MQWPEFYHGIKDRLYEHWGMEKITFLRTLGGGKSQALVYVIEILSKVHNGQAVLKFSTKSEWSVTEQVESIRFKKVCTGEYARLHFPPLLATFEDEEYFAALVEIAGGDINLLSSLYECPVNQRNKVILTLSTGILKGWNSDCKLNSALPPAFILREWLGYRIIPAEGGRIFEFVEKELKLNRESRLCNSGGRWYPNPCAYVANNSLWHKEEIIGIKGRLHGDLHGGNILGKSNFADALYYLIDFALAEEEAFLFYDHAYLELSLLFSEIGYVAPEQWLGILQSLVSSDPFDVNLAGEDPGVVHNIWNIRQGIRSWAAVHPLVAGHAKEVAKQTLLARIAAGLNFVNKDIEPRLRKFAFLYAAENLRKYLECAKINWYEEKCETLKVKKHSAGFGQVSM